MDVLPACALHADREVVRINCLLHPPLNPLPSREGKERNPYQGRGRKEIPIKGGERMREPPIKGVFILAAPTCVA